MNNAVRRDRLFAFNALSVNSGGFIFEVDIDIRFACGFRINSLEL